MNRAGRRLWLQNRRDCGGQCRCGACLSTCPEIAGLGPQAGGLAGFVAHLTAPLAGDPGDPAQGPSFAPGQANTSAAAPAGAGGDERELQQPPAGAGNRGLIGRGIGHGSLIIRTRARPAIIVKSRPSARVPSILHLSTPRRGAPARLSASKDTTMEGREARVHNAIRSSGILRGDYAGTAKAWGAQAQRYPECTCGNAARRSWTTHGDRDGGRRGGDHAGARWARRTT